PFRPGWNVKSNELCRDTFSEAGGKPRMRMDPEDQEDSAVIPLCSTLGRTILLTNERLQDSQQEPSDIILLTPWTGQTGKSEVESPFPLIVLVRCDEIFGLSVSARWNSDIFQIWNMDSSKRENGRVMQKVTEILKDVQIQSPFYKAHKDHDDFKK
ncbi:hypothetical protein BGW38_004726, partial [Lunasporangiospora selenospora]